MSIYRSTRKATQCVALMAAAVLLSACQQDGHPHAHKPKFPLEDGDPIIRADTFPMADASRFDQSYPDKPLFGSTNYLRSKDVLPPAKADIREPLPPAVPLPVAQANIGVIQPQASTAEPAEEQGGVTPAAGMAAVITNAQGDGERTKLDGASTEK